MAKMRIHPKHIPAFVRMGWEVGSDIPVRTYVVRDFDPFGNEISYKATTPPRVEIFSPKSRKEAREDFKRVMADAAFRYASKAKKVA